MKITFTKLDLPKAGNCTNSKDRVAIEEPVEGTQSEEQENFFFDKI